MKIPKRFGTASFITAILLIANIGTLSAQTPQTPVALSVVVRNPLPGFREENAAAYLADRMAATDLADWRFGVDSTATLPPANRIEWRFDLDPYASAGVRQFVPIPQVQRLFGTQHHITAEAMLYIDNEYQTLVMGQATIRGGDQDPDLAAFITGMTANLLGPHGAYRSIDMAPAAGPH